MSAGKLPEGWVNTTIENISVKCSQRVPCENEEFIYVDIGSINRDLKVIESPQYLSGKNAPSRARKVIKAGDIIVSLTRPNLNAVALVDEKYDEQIASTGFEVIHPVQVESKYIFGLVRSRHFIDSISGLVQGALYPAAKSSDVQSYKFPLPPLAEQKIIAVKLDTLLAQVDSTKSRLEKIPQILKRFRQAVLVSAINGKLTKELHETNQFKQTELSISIPSSWKISEIGQFVDVKGGKRLPKGESLITENSGFPYIRAGQLKNGTVIPEGQLYLEEHTQKSISRYTVSTGDIYITIVGACIGDTGIIPEEYNNANLTENAAKLCNLKEGISNKFLSLWLRSSFLQDIINSEIKSGAQGKLALARIKSLPLLLPPLPEQHEIVRRVEQLFAWADSIEKQVNNALASVNNLTQSILAKAFRGELTAQWRAENPELISGENSAAALLEKIKAERAASGGKKASRKKV